jgi:putative inorganic carbon (hco3(-)) transporter
MYLIVIGKTKSVLPIVLLSMKPIPKVWEHSPEKITAGWSNLATTSIPVESLHPARRIQETAGKLVLVIAQGMFMLMVVAIPWRYRFTLLQRPRPPIYGDYTDFLLFAADILMIATLLFWLAGLALQHRSIQAGPMVISLPLAGLTLAGIASIPFSADPALSAYQALRLILLGGLYLYVVNEIHSWRTIVLPAALMILSQGWVAISQTLTQHSIGLQALGEYALNPQWSGVSIVLSGGVRILRAYGLADHPNILGGCLAMALLALGIWSAGQPANPWRPLIMGTLGIGSLALLYTFSRSAWMALVGGAMLAAGFFYKTSQRDIGRRWLLTGLGILIMLVPFIFNLAPALGIRLGFGGSFTQVATEEQSLGERKLLDETANQLFENQPLTGVGLGAFVLAQQAAFPNFPVDYQPAHLVLLDAAAETGIFGALFYASLLLAPWAALWLGRKRLHFSVELVGASALLLAISLIGLFDYYTWLLVPGRLWCWLAWGLWAASYRSASFGGRYNA